MQEIYSGIVIKGDGRGRTIGYPTANIDISKLIIDIEPGVYSSITTYDNTPYKAILFFGPKKTFNQVENTLEVHILDFDQDIYDQELEFTIGQFIRGPVKFNSVEELVTQIKSDIEQID
ncbi:MAG: riboflavin kinase [Candidatus Pacebacteria bacterium]|nr:riboflavin kinase [Candidatus Paceibacterota bacterium]